MKSKGKKKTIPRHDSTRENEAAIIHIHQRIFRKEFPTVKQLAEELKITERGVKRYIRAMKTHRNMPISTSRRAGQEGYYYSEPVSASIGRTFDELEVMKLFIGNSSVDQLPVKQRQKNLAFGFDKISQLLDSRTQKILKELQGSVFFRPFAPEPICVDTFMAIAECIRKTRVIRFCYTKHLAELPEVKEVRPYCFTCAGNSWYLIAFDLKSGEMRTYLLSRLTNPKITTETFKKPKFNLDDYLDGAFIIMKGKESHDVVVEFDSWAAPYIRNRKFTRDQKIEELENGGLRISFHLTCLEEVEAWICYWRTHARAVGPAALVNRLHDYGQYLIKAHPKIEVK